MEYCSFESEDIKEIQLKVSAAQYNPSYATAYVKAYTICTLHLLRTRAVFQMQNSRMAGLAKKDTFSSYSINTGYGSHGLRGRRKKLA